MGPLPRSTAANRAAVGGNGATRFGVSWRTCALKDGADGWQVDLVRTGKWMNMFTIYLVKMVDFFDSYVGLPKDTTVPHEINTKNKG